MVGIDAPSEKVPTGATHCFLLASTKVSFSTVMENGKSRPGKLTSLPLNFTGLLIKLQSPDDLPVQEAVEIVGVLLRLGLDDKLCFGAQAVANKETQTRPYRIFIFFSTAPDVNCKQLWSIRFLMSN